MIADDYVCGLNNFSVGGTPDLTSHYNNKQNHTWANMHCYFQITHSNIPQIRGSQYTIYCHHVKSLATENDEYEFLAYFIMRVHRQNTNTSAFDLHWTATLNLLLTRLDADWEFPLLN